MVELLDRFDQAHVAFLNQIQEQHAAADVTLGDADDEPQIRFRQPSFRFFVAMLDPLRQLHFVVGRQAAARGRFPSSTSVPDR